MSSATPTTAPPSGSGPDGPPTEAPGRARPARADVVAAVVVWLGVVLGLAAKLGFAGWGVLVVLALWPVTIVLPVVGAWIAARPLLGLGSVRRRAGYASTRYRVLAWVLGLGVLLGYGAMPDGGDAARRARPCRRWSARLSRRTRWARSRCGSWSPRSRPR